jgi:two-component system nitrate/nitrite response regulator NarL
MRIREAVPDDGPGLVQLFLDTPLRAGTTLVLDREPDFFASSRPLLASGTFIIDGGRAPEGVVTVRWRRATDASRSVTVGGVADFRIASPNRLRNRKTFPSAPHGRLHGPRILQQKMRAAGDTAGYSCCTTAERSGQAADGPRPQRESQELTGMSRGEYAAAGSRTPESLHGRVRVVVADEQPVTLVGLAQLVCAEADLEVVAACATGSAVLTAARQLNPDVVVMSLRMQDKSAVTVLRELASEGVAASIVVLTESLSDRETVSAVRAGIKGIVLKDMPTPLLLRCIRKVARGETWLERASARGALVRMVRREDAFRHVDRLLTPRELEVFRLVLRGLSNREIGRAITVSEGTIKAHLHNIFHKLKVKRRAELFVYARIRQLL